MKDSSDPACKTLLDRLVATHEAGRLVPFIGSGMSRPACTDWAGFVAALEHAVAPGSAPAAGTGHDDLVRRANTAVRSLAGRDSDAYQDAVRCALVDAKGAPAGIPPQTRALARIRWPLVLTTNYDNVYAAAFARAHQDVRLSVVGRGAEDCQRVLNSLSTAGRPLLWALQGHVADLPFGAVPADAAAALQAQLVVGHEAYRRVTYREQPFRRAFAEVFRQRSLLFLGSGLKETYLQELFGEVLETFGPSTRPHYAVVQQGEVDTAFLLARFQIVCLEYPQGGHGFVGAWLRKLAARVRQPARTQVSWSWGRIERRRPHWVSVPDLELVRGPLPMEPRDGECLAVSAGGRGDGFGFSAGIERVIRAWKVPEPLQAEPLEPPYLGWFAGHPVYAVRAHDEVTERNLADIHRASLALFRRVAPAYRCIRMQLIATGGTDKSGTSDALAIRPYPERFSFVQTVRAWAIWRRENPTVDCRLALHVVLDSVVLDVASGRIDVLELLSCADMRFFVEVAAAAGEPERRLFQSPPGDTLQRIVDALQLTEPFWAINVTPPPDSVDAWLPLDEDTLARTLESIGVLPGSTIHIRRIRSAGRDTAAHGPEPHT